MRSRVPRYLDTTCTLIILTQTAQRRRATTEYVRRTNGNVQRGFVVYAPASLILTQTAPNRSGVMKKTTVGLALVIVTLLYWFQQAAAGGNV